MDNSGAYESLERSPYEDQDDNVYSPDHTGNSSRATTSTKDHRDGRAAINARYYLKKRAKAAAELLKAQSDEQLQMSMLSVERLRIPELRARLTHCEDVLRQSVLWAGPPTSGAGEQWITFEETAMSDDRPSEAPLLSETSGRGPEKRKTGPKRKTADTAATSSLKLSAEEKKARSVKDHREAQARYAERSKAYPKEALLQFHQSRADTASTFIKRIAALSEEVDRLETIAVNSHLPPYPATVAGISSVDTEPGPYSTDRTIGPPLTDDQHTFAWDDDFAAFNPDPEAWETEADASYIEQALDALNVGEFGAF